MHLDNDFTYDLVNYNGLPAFVQKLHDLGMHYIPIIDPAVSASEEPGSYPPYDRGVQLGIFIKNETDQPFIGKVWNRKSSVWPDFTHPLATDYWTQMFKLYHDEVPFDGAWIE